jgi:hypothetical protein
MEVVVAGIPALVAVGFGLVCLAAVAFFAQDRARRRREMVAELGLEPIEGGFAGEIGGRWVRLTTERRGGKNKVTWHLVEIALPEVPPDLSCAPDGPLARGPDLRLGDPAFDRGFQVDLGEAGLAWLDATVRRELLRFERATLRHGHLVVEQRDVIPEAAFVRRAVALAARLGDRDPRAALADMAVRDPMPWVRLRAAAAAAPEDAPALAEALADRRDALDTVAHAILVRSGPALAAALARTPTDDLYVAVDALGRLEDPGLLAAAIGTVSRLRPPRPVWFLLTAAAARLPTAEVRAAVLRALPEAPGDAVGFWADRAVVALAAQPAGAETEAALADLLALAESEHPRALAWLEAHGTVGSVPAVDALHQRSWALGPTREAATRTKRAIQTRAGGDRGGLALADDTGGGLSVAETSAGRLARARQSEG